MDEKIIATAKIIESRYKKSSEERHRNPVEAAAAAILKWRDIVAGTRALEEGGQLCSMCDLYIDYDCNKNWGANCTDCPLQKSGHGCLERNSVWRKFDEALDCPFGDNIKELSQEMYEIIYNICSKIIIANYYREDQ